MAKQTITKCDQCEAIKGDANHWLEFHGMKRHGVVVALVVTRAGDEGRHFMIRSDSVSAEKIDLCGAACLQRMVSTLAGIGTAAVPQSITIPPEIEEPF